MSIPKFPVTPESFYSVLKTRINAYFEDYGKPTTGNRQLFSKAIILLAGLVAVYIHLFFFTPPLLFMIGESLLLGGLIASIGFNIMHDGAHGSFSSFPWVNRLAAATLNILGGNSFMWNMKHNVIHHAYTNVAGVDDDIEIQPWMRMSSIQKKRKLHKYQHLYFWVLYSFLYILWIFFLDYQKYFSRKIGPMPIKTILVTASLVSWSIRA